ncbi:MAG TPA: hypothetical protein VKX25_18120 [Bryobacteraceae bacterium]|nr:hypothetical protein [Bryobacteraceae bacterium]
MNWLRCALLSSVFVALGGAQKVDIYTADDLKSMGEALQPKGPVSAVKDLERYRGHYFLLAKRVETGSSELHEHDADVFVMESGDCQIVTGGKIIGGRSTGPGEIRGRSIEGGTKHELRAGDVIHIPAGVAHQMLVKKGTPIVYFVVKVSGQ